jgi:cation transporter-like permease
MTWKFIISVIVTFVMLFALGWLVHGGLLNADYARLPNLMRPMSEVRGNILFMFAAQLSTAIAFVWIYRKGKEDKPWLTQGVRYGIAVAFLVTIPVNLVHYAVMPFPLDFALKAMVLDGLSIVLVGAVVAWINR